MDRGKWIIVLVLILLTASVSAEIFKYVDKDGNVLYTDDLSVVPEEQRPGIDVVSEAADKAYSAPEDTKPQQAQTKTAETNDSEEIKERLEKQREALAKEATALQEEIEGLKKEKEALVSSRRFKSGADSRIMKQLKGLNKKIAASKQKFQDFEKKKAVYEVEMKTMQTE